MSDRHDKAGPDKHVRLTKIDALRITDHVCRAKHDEETIPVLLDLRPLVRAMRILDGQVVKAKFLLDFAQQLLIGFEQADPDKPVLMLELFADVRDLDVCHSDPLRVRGTIDDSGTL